MSEWLSYTLHDLLIFSPEAYAGLFEVYNKALWPYQIPLLIASLVLLIGFKVKPTRFARAVMFGLSLSWLFVSLWFLKGYYSQLNPLAESLIYVFMFQSVFLFWGAFNTGTLNFENSGNLNQKTFITLSGLLLVYAYFLHPLVQLFSGRQINGLEFVMLAPDPTAIATLGFLLVIRPKAYVLLMVIPLLWLNLSLLTYIAF